MSPKDEARFQKEIKATDWYKEWGDRPPNLNDPGYKYRLAWKNGVHLKAKRNSVDGKIHWESSLADGTSLKSADHESFWKEEMWRKYDIDVDKLGLKTEKAAEAYIKKHRGKE